MKISKNVHFIVLEKIQSIWIVHRAYCKSAVLNFGLVIILFSMQPVLAQDKAPKIQELLTKSQSFYDNNPVFQVDLRYKLYRTPEKPVEIERYNGILIKNNNEFYLQIHQTEMISSGKHYLKVNHEQKAMEYWLLPNTGPENNPLDLEGYLKFFAVRNVFDGGDVWVCELITPKYTQLPYASAIFYLDKRTYEIKKQVIELMTPGNIKDEKGKLTAERKFLETTMSNFTVNPEKIKKHPQISTYIDIKREGIVPLLTYSSYEFYDRR